MLKDSSVGTGHKLLKLQTCRSLYFYEILNLRNIRNLILTGRLDDVTVTKNDHHCYSDFPRLVIQDGNDGAICGNADDNHVEDTRYTD